MILDTICIGVSGSSSENAMFHKPIPVCVLPSFQPNKSKGSVSGDNLLGLRIVILLLSLPFGMAAFGGYA